MSGSLRRQPITVRRKHSGVHLFAADIRSQQDLSEYVVHLYNQSLLFGILGSINRNNRSSRLLKTLVDRTGDSTDYEVYSQYTLYLLEIFLTHVSVFDNEAYTCEIIIYT